jgi:hypothetical protein
MVAPISKQVYQLKTVSNIVVTSSQNYVLWIRENMYRIFKGLTLCCGFRFISLVRTVEIPILIIGLKTGFTEAC